MQAMLLAAGFGTRLRPYTLVRPKPLFPVCNRPLLHILLDKLTQAGCGRTVVNCHYLADQIAAAAAAGRHEVILQHEQEVLGTGGCLRKALPHFADEPVLVMNGDVCHDIDLSGLLEAHKQSGQPVTMALHDCPRFNVVQVRGDLVCGFGRAGAGEQDLAFTGIHVLNPEVLEQIPAQGFFHIIDLYERLALAGQIGFIRTDGCFWQDIGTPADYLDLHRRLLEGKLPAWLISESAEIGSGVKLSDWGVIGAGAKIGKGAELRRCVVWDKAEIAPGQRLADQIACSVMSKKNPLGG
jgi:mannose-1-phosphate guanylyltransferase